MAASLYNQASSSAVSGSSSVIKVMAGSVPVCHKFRNGKCPGTKCPTCAARGKEVWVIPGRLCGYCGTPCE